MENETASYDDNVGKMAKHQTRALLICGALMVFGFLAIAINVRTIMDMQYPVLAVIIAQIPAALAGLYLTWILMSAGRSENLRKDTE